MAWCDTYIKFPNEYRDLHRNPESLAALSPEDDDLSYFDSTAFKPLMAELKTSDHLCAPQTSAEKKS